MKEGNKPHTKKRCAPQRPAPAGPRPGRPTWLWNTGRKRSANAQDHCWPSCVSTCGVRKSTVSPPGDDTWEGPDGKNCQSTRFHKEEFSSDDSPAVATLLPPTALVSGAQRQHGPHCDPRSTSRSGSQLDVSTRLLRAVLSPHASLLGTGMFPPSLDTQVYGNHPTKGTAREVPVQIVFVQGNCIYNPAPRQVQPTSGQDQEVTINLGRTSTRPFETEQVFSESTQPFQSPLFFFQLPRKRLTFPNGPSASGGTAPWQPVARSAQSHGALHPGSEPRTPAFRWVDGTNPVLLKTHTHPPFHMKRARRGLKGQSSQQKVLGEG